MSAPRSNPTARPTTDGGDSRSAPAASVTDHSRGSGRPRTGPVGERTAGECKLDIAARNIARLWQHTEQLTYTDPESGQPSPIPGALQIVFCDLSTPGDCRCTGDVRSQGEQAALLGVVTGLVDEANPLARDSVLDEQAAQLVV